MKTEQNDDKRSLSSFLPARHEVRARPAAAVWLTLCSASSAASVAAARIAALNARLMAEGKIDAIPVNVRDSAR